MDYSAVPDPTEELDGDSEGDSVSAALFRNSPSGRFRRLVDRVKKSWVFEETVKLLKLDVPLVGYVLLFMFLWDWLVKESFVLMKK